MFLFCRNSETESVEEEEEEEEKKEELGEANKGEEKNNKVVMASYFSNITNDFSFVNIAISTAIMMVLPCLRHCHQNQNCHQNPILIQG